MPCAWQAATKRLKAVRAAVVLGDGVQGDAVVAPAAVAGGLDDGHDFDVGDAELEEVLEAVDGGIEGAGGGEGADVELVDDGAGERRALPEGVVPAEGAVVVNGGRVVDAFGLRERAWVGDRRGVFVEKESVLRAGVGFLDAGFPGSGLVRTLHGVDGAVYLDADLLRDGGPEGEFMHRGSSLGLGGGSL